MANGVPRMVIVSSVAHYSGVAEFGATLCEAIVEILHQSSAEAEGLLTRVLLGHSVDRIDGCGRLPCEEVMGGFGTEVKTILIETDGLFPAELLGRTDYGDWYGSHCYFSCQEAACGFRAAVETVAGLYRPHLNVGILGHIDHGKTTLTAALGMNLAVKYKPDGGTDIPVAHVEYETPYGQYAHIHCPGHADYIKIKKMDGVIVVVPRPPHTRRRTKFDSSDFAQAVWTSFFAPRRERSTFMEPRRLVAFLMSVEDVFSIRGRGTVGAGCIERGEVQVVGLTKQPRQPVVAGVEMFNETLEYGSAGDNVGVLLRGGLHRDLKPANIMAIRLTQEGQAVLPSIDGIPVRARTLSATACSSVYREVSHVSIQRKRTHLCLNELGPRPLAAGEWGLVWVTWQVTPWLNGVEDHHRQGRPLSPTTWVSPAPVATGRRTASPDRSFTTRASSSGSRASGSWRLPTAPASRSWWASGRLALTCTTAGGSPAPALTVAAQATWCSAPGMSATRWPWAPWRPRSASREGTSASIAARSTSGACTPAAATAITGGCGDRGLLRPVRGTEQRLQRHAEGKEVHHG